MEKLIEVRDQKNPERLLGRLSFKPDCEVREGMVVHSNFFPPFDVRDTYRLDSHDPYRDVVRVTFNVAYRSENNGLVRVAELRTDTPLGVLMMMREFLLPGETEREAYNRRARNLYYDRNGLI